MPLLNLIGLPRAARGVRDAAVGHRAGRRSTSIAGRTARRRRATGCWPRPSTRLDRELLGVAHPVDHRFLRSESRRGWLYRGPDGAPVGYGYAGEAGRVGPVAVRDAGAPRPRSSGT